MDDGASLRLIHARAEGVNKRRHAAVCPTNWTMEIKGDPANLPCVSPKMNTGTPIAIIAMNIHATNRTRALEISNTIADMMITLIIRLDSLLIGAVSSAIWTKPSATVPSIVHSK
jgi:hypothetical protein